MPGREAWGIRLVRGHQRGGLQETGPGNRGHAYCGIVAGIPPGGKGDLEENSVKADELLLWLSARGEGSWRTFRAAVEQLRLAEDLERAGDEEFGGADFPVHQQLRLNMERLGHVEFFAHGCEEGWRVTPPALAARRDSSGWMG